MRSHQNSFLVLRANIYEYSGTNQVVYIVTTKDDSSIAYSLVDELEDDRALFTINEENGEVRLSENPDNDTKIKLHFYS